MVLDNDSFLGIERKKLLKFTLVGLIASAQFQKCRYLVEKLYVCYPKDFAKPEIRSMLNLDWDEYLTKMKRRHGKPFYLLEAPLVVYLDGVFMGDDKALNGYVTKNYSLEINLDFEDIVEKELIKYFSDIIQKYKRKFVYLTIAIDEHVAGSMLFMLYNDLVPITCDNFINRCTDRLHGYKGTKIHRIAKYSWIQCGGFDLQHYHMPCENYAVPHNRRGVLSMCNKKRHEDNSTQFYITLEPAPWMDYNYVAFGQLIQGAEILNLIEKVSTYYENPLKKIQIVNCGEFSLCPVPDKEYATALNPPYAELFNEELKPDDIDSILSATGYKSKKYCLKTDLRAYKPFSRYSRLFDSYLNEIVEPVEHTDDAKIEEVLKSLNVDIETEKSDSNMTINKAMEEFFKSSKAFYHKHIIL